ncbi:MAG TPA: RNA polymerase sigma factor [Segetibacter sp.]
MAIDNQTATALVHRAIDGDQYAMKELYAYYSNDMFNIAMRMTANREDAEDVIQESFIKAFKSLSQLNDAGIFGGWLRKIVINTCLRHVKKRVVYNVLPESLEEAEEENTEWLSESSFSAIHDGIKKLPEGCRQIFLLYAMEDYKHKEIGSLLNISESTSKSQYLRAKKLLQQHLKKEQWIR